MFISDPQETTMFCHEQRGRSSSPLFATNGHIGGMRVTSPRMAISKLLDHVQQSFLVSQISLQDSMGWR